ncbi:MAG TPA: ABC transporter substrate-binding protein [Hyphomicrobiaceae bacterium]|nr:ABC transporter substrate-binding protein [Hyphomicrobiaceae bacterium]
MHRRRDMAHWLSGNDPASDGLTRREAMAMAALALSCGLPARAHGAETEGQLTWAVHISLAPTWFDPAETPGIITPFMVLYALHDAMVKPMPGNPLAPSLAESWTATPDGLGYEFVLRKGAKFHNGDPVTAEDVKFSFDRYRGTSAKQMHDRVASVEVLDPQRVAFKLKSPWPDFLTFYATATGAGWIVPKKYVEKVGDEAYKKAPVGAGPYKFASFTPGVELTLDAYDDYWRKKPSVKRLIFKSIHDESTRLAALKRGEVDIVYSIRGELAEELQRTKGLTLKPTVINAPFWLYFADQWDAKSPWHDQRVRLAASLAIDRNSINEALTLGHSKITGSIIPESFEYYWPTPPPVFDPAKAKKLLAEAGHANGFDAGEYYCDTTYSNVAEAVLNNLQTVGIRAKLRPLERAAFFKGYSEKNFKNIIQGASGAFGNAATRLETFAVTGGAYVYGSYPDIDALFKEQAAELDKKKREALLHKIQQLVHEKTIYAHIWQLAFINGAGPRVKESGLGLIEGHAYSAPYEDLALAGK